MKVIIVFIFAVLFSVNCYSQDNINDIFKSLLVLNGTITLKENNKIKDSELETLISNIDLEIDELKSNTFSSTFFYDYKVYRFNLDTNKISLKDNIPVIFNFGLCTEYILIYNQVLGRYYRIKGFKNNDFNSLLNDIILYHDEKIKVKQVIKELESLNYKEIDFKCLYEALKDSPKNRWKYHCLSICTDAKPAH